MKKTMNNKILSSVMMIAGAGSIFIDGDITIFAFLMILGLPLFFAKRNWVN